MSVRIQNHDLAGTGPAQAGRADETSRVANLKHKDTPGLDGNGQDRVEISSLSERVAAVGEAQDAQQAQRVRKLAALYESGQYRVDPLQLSRALVSHAIAGAPEESKA
jgi:anti-sigma28 factor (negative regulator of flagellin synthesis)